MSEPELSQDLPAAAGKSAGWMMVLGIITILLGAFVVSTPFVAGLSVVMLTGALFAATGVLQVIHGFGAQGWKGKAWEILVGLLGVVGGVLVLNRPLIGLGVFALVLAVYFLVEGVAGAVMAFRHKPEAGWGWMLFNSIVTVLLGVLIWRQWPLSGGWAIGILVGVRILMAGMGMLLFGSAVRAAASGR